jgi:hypothetical protein
MEFTEEDLVKLNRRRERHKSEVDQPPSPNDIKQLHDDLERILKNTSNRSN